MVEAYGGWPPKQWPLSVAEAALRETQDSALAIVHDNLLKRQRGTVRCVGRGRWEATADAAIPAPDVENVDQHWFADRAVDHTAGPNAEPTVTRPPRMVPSLADA